MISAAALTMAIVCVLLCGFALGACMTYWLIIRYCKNNPQAFAAFFGAGLASLGERCGRTHLHFLDDAGCPVALPVGSVARSIRVELATWLEHYQRGIS